MKQFKGTPAPWDVDDCGHYYDIIRKGNNSLGYMELLDSKKFGKEISAANAHLIAAAPELLDALIEMQRNGQKQGWNDKYETSMEKTSKAIKKALGKLHV